LKNNGGIGFLGDGFSHLDDKTPKKKEKEKKMYSHKVPVYLKSPKFEENVLKIF
jgi:hypothetical protein